MAEDESESDQEESIQHVQIKKDGADGKMDLIVHELKTNIPANGKSEKRLALAEETTDDS